MRKKHTLELTINNVVVFFFIFLGYVMYEMCTGCEVQGLLPTDDEYTAIEDVKCGTLLQYIFSRKDKSKTSFKHSIHEVSMPKGPIPSLTDSIAI